LLFFQFFKEIEMRSFNPYLSGAARFVFAATVAVSLFLSPQARAADEFNHVVRIIVGAAPGGTSDFTARIIAPKLSEAIGQTVIVENKPGAGGNVGADFVAKAPKDGHTLMLMDVGMLATTPNLFSNMTYDVQKDLAPVGMVMFVPYILAVNPSLPVKTIDEFINYSKANPGKVKVANAGIGSAIHLTGIIIAKGKGLDWKYVPYKGGGPAAQAVLSGESNMVINSFVSLMPFVTSGQMLGLAVTGKERVKNLADMPTFREAGLAQPDAGSFQGLVTTAGTPPAVIQRLSDELRKILAQPDIQEKIAKQGGVIQSGKPDDLRDWLQEYIKIYGDVIRSSNIKVE
jgi:tripartite-type tricarboxylate transporter receptor subunit TctC